MTKILLVFTGGTIGSTAVQGTISTSSEAPYLLLQLFQQHYPPHQQIVFNSLRPLNILSENLHPLEWESLISAIEAENPSDYDGIIITHGTDTLAFTAAALGLYFNWLEIPVLLVSSNYPLNHPEANGLANFLAAVDYIQQRQPAGVYVSYQNPQQPQIIHVATRLASSLQLSGDFVSIQNRIHLQYSQGRFEISQELDRGHCQKLRLQAKFTQPIKLIRPYPGLNYQTMTGQPNEVILHDLYHSGTACVAPSAGNDYSLLWFAKYCREQNIKLYLAPAIKHPDVYQSTRKLLDEGVEIIWNMSLESAYVKLLLAYGNFSQHNEITRFLNQDIALEHI